MKSRRIRVTSIAAMAITGLCQAKPAQVPADWRTECIGYFNISVPGEVDIAMATIKTDGRVTTPAFSYARQPLFCSLVHGGEFQVSEDVSYDFFTKKRNNDIKKLEELKIEEAKSGGHFRSYDISRDDYFSETFAGSEDTWITSYRWADNRMYLHEINTKYHKFSDARLNAYVSEFSDKFRPRKLYEIPQEPGFCIPYGFVKSTMPQPPRKLAQALVLQ